MNESIFKTLIIAMSIILGAWLLSQTQNNALKSNRTVQVKGLAEREEKADLAVWPIQVTLTSNNLSDLKKQLDSQKETVNIFFKNQGFNDQEFTAGMINIQDTEANPYGNNQYQTFRYIANMDFTVRTNEIEKLQNALTASLELVSKGILIDSKDNWQPIEYIFTRLNDIKPAMIEEATKKAREVAEKFAEDSNSEVGKIKKAYQGVFSISNRDQNSPHIKVIRVVTTVDYFLKD
jgi:hypothetical protein